MRTARPRRPRAFTMIELIVVISIIGIITAIALPRFSRGVGSSGAASLYQNLSVLRSALECYANEHSGDYPASTGDGVNAAHSESAFVRQLTMFSDANGRVQSQKSGAFRYGPYLRKGMPPLPVGPFAGATGVRVVTGNVEPVFVNNSLIGWVYNDTTGNIIANLDAGAAAKVTQDKMLRNELITRDGG